MRTLTMLVVLMATTAIAGQANGQASEGAGWQRATILAELVHSSGRRGKLLALDRLADMVKQGQVKPDDSQLISILGQMAEQGSMIKRYDSKLDLVNDYVMMRAAAAQLLGEIGGPFASARLASILENEQESLVMSVALKAYRTSVGQQNSYSASMLIGSFMRMHESRRDNTLATAYLDVLESLTEEDKGLLSPDMIYSVRRIAWDASGYLAPVRNKALSLLLSWL